MDYKGKGPANLQGLKERANSIQPSNRFLAQQKRVFKAFFGPPKSMLEVEAETGVMRSNICWYVAKCQTGKSIQRVFTGACSITKMRVGKYSTNPIYWLKGGENGR